MRNRMDEPQRLALAARTRVSPLLNMLNVRYVIARGLAKPGYYPVLQGGDYVIWRNTAALPRAFVPKHVETIADAKERMRRFGPQF